MYFFIHKITNK